MFSTSCASVSQNQIIHWILLASISNDYNGKSTEKLLVWEKKSEKYEKNDNK